MLPNRGPFSHAKNTAIRREEGPDERNRPRGGHHEPPWKGRAGFHQSRISRFPFGSPSCEGGAVFDVPRRKGVPRHFPSGSWDERPGDCCPPCQASPPTLSRTPGGNQTCLCVRLDARGSSQSPEDPDALDVSNTRTVYDTQAVFSSRLPRPPRVLIS